MLENYSWDDRGDVELENKEITNHDNKSMNEATSKLFTPIKTFSDYKLFPYSLSLNIL